MSLSRLAVVAAVIVGLLVAPAASLAQHAADALSATDCSYGDVYQFTPAGCVATIRNEGTKPLKLSITSVQPGNTVEPRELVLAPHANASLSLKVATANISGGVTWTYRIDGAGSEPTFVHADGFVSSVLDVGRPEIDFGTVDPTTLPLLQTIALPSSVDSKVRVTRVISAPAELHAVVGPDGKSLTVELAKDAPWGTYDATIKLALDHPQQKQAWVHVTGRVSGEIGPATNPHWLGEFAWEPTSVLAVPLIDQHGRDFTIGAVASEDFSATYGSAPCEPVRAGCRNLLIHVAEDQPPGMFKSTLNVSLPDRKKKLLLAIWGVRGERPKPGQTPVAPTMTRVPVSTAKTDDGVTAIPPLMQQPDPPGSGPLLKWTIDQQQSVHGYQILRGESADGPFVLLTPALIPKQDNGRGAVAYRWRDTTAERGRKYWYYITVVYTSGDRHALSTPQETLAK